LRLKRELIIASVTGEFNTRSCTNY